MKNRVIFDTNIYGFIAKEPEITPSIIHNDKLLVYGCSLIRKEIREISLKKARDDVLSLYDHITQEHNLRVTDASEKLAKEYYKEAKKINKNRIKNIDKYWEDLLIVAVASLNNLDIVFTEDKIMRDSHRTAYGIVNLRNKLRSPTFYSYDILKKSFVK